MNTSPEQIEIFSARIKKKKKLFLFNDEGGEKRELEKQTERIIWTTIQVEKVTDRTKKIKELTHLQSFRKFLEVKGHISVCRSITMSPRLVTISTDMASGFCLSVSANYGWCSQYKAQTENGFPCIWELWEKKERSQRETDRDGGSGTSNWEGSGSIGREGRILKQIACGKMYDKDHLKPMIPSHVLEAWSRLRPYAQDFGLLDQFFSLRALV